MQARKAACGRVLFCGYAANSDAATAKVHLKSRFQPIFELRQVHRGHTSPLIKALFAKIAALSFGIQPASLFLKQKVESVRLRKLIEQQGAVKEKAKWLIDYWGSKTIAGLVLMPATRHNYLHLNRSIRIKNKCQK
ncbi:hypothetical protein [Paenibacillus sp. OSY-SE]|uniref:hypothetical protein n=1 Tax=Paenibacillus sp. OSY-SE TaxID=1196323 RepID=UPI00035E0CF5|nr:hypothetical protein [Paenibacillus sp. OSY-SE]